MRLILSFLLLSSAAAAQPTMTLHNGEVIPRYGWDAPDYNDAPVDPDASVRILSGRHIVLVGNHSYRDILIENGGQLELADGCNLSVKTITLDGMGAKLSADNISGSIAFRDIPIDLTIDPKQYGNGIVCNDGTVHLSGKNPRTPFVDVAVEVLQGHTFITLTASPANWQPGDVLVIPHTKQSNVLQSEKAVIASIDGLDVHLTGPVQYDHPGWHQQDGTVEALYSVANLTVSDFEMRSENAGGTRGHCLWSGHADVAYVGVALVGMGRTTSVPLNTPANQIARYPLHFHHVIGRANNGKPYQGRIENCSIDGRGVSKWGIAIHGTHWCNASFNVIYNCTGAGIVTELPTEHGNVISHNWIGFQSPGSGEAMTARASRNQAGGDHWHNRVGLALASAKQTITDNQVYGAADGIGMIGFATTAIGKFPLESAKGMHVDFNNGSQRGTRWEHWGIIPGYGPSDGPYPFVFPTTGNKLWGCGVGIETWTANSFAEVVDGEMVPQYGLGMFPGLEIYHSRFGTDLEDQEETATFDWKIRGNYSQVTYPTTNGDNNSVGIKFKPGYEFGTIHTRLEVSGMDMAYRRINPKAYTRHYDCKFECPVVVYDPQGYFTRNQGWEGLWKGCEFKPVNGTLKFIDGWYSKYDITQWCKPNNTTREFLRPITYRVLPWANGVNYGVYHDYQSPDWVHPSGPPPAGQAYADFPVGVHTNAQLIANGTPLHGEVQPEWARSFPWVLSPYFVAAEVLPKPCCPCGPDCGCGDNCQCGVQTVELLKDTLIRLKQLENP